ncbi:hypothetical protein PQS31_08480 [Luteimonas sp BLCC-B24]|uniref:hypothetical protein n=1 Tax=Luteimonas sp. BLCC-B24 TaxID=3025317 RepID=UPI00234D4C85|nr:hypothetical protein [Luteimonas sp. BLCC-B24]MDC7806853.1 hypothetical protein [Luteimonas sp. BLCC-B24]
MANLLTTAVLAALVAWLPMPAWLAGTLIGAAPGAATLGLGDLFPLHVQGWRSDGRGLLDLARRTPDAALQVQINQRMALSHVGVRPRDWPASAMPADDGAAASAGLRLSRAIDARDADGARADALALADAFHGAPAICQSAIAVALASHAALLVGDRALVAAWRRRCEGGLRTCRRIARGWTRRSPGSTAMPPRVRRIANVRGLITGFRMRRAGRCSTHGCPSSGGTDRAGARSRASPDDPAAPHSPRGAARRRTALLCKARLTGGTCGRMLAVKLT